MQLGIPDLIFSAILIFFVIKVSIKGFIAEFFSKAAVILGGLVAVLFYKMLTPVITNLLGPQVISPVIAFLILFLSVYLIIKLIEVLLGSLFSSESLQSLDRALGFFLGIIEGLLVITIILMALNIQPFINSEEILTGSIFAKILSPFIFNIENIF